VRRWITLFKNKLGGLVFEYLGLLNQRKKDLTKYK